MIAGNPIWNQHVAAMTTKERPLYTFEIPDEALIITTFFPAEVGVTVDTENLITQPLWFLAALKAAALKNVSLVPTSGFVLPGVDGQAIAIPPNASVERFNFGTGITGYTAYFSWLGISFPPGMQDIRRAATLDLVLVSSLDESGSYSPYANVGYSVNGIPAEVTTWFSAIHDNSAGWSPRTDTVRLWPGNVDVGADLPDINKIQIQVSQEETGTGSDPLGIIFNVAPTLLVGFL